MKKVRGRSGRPDRIELIVTIDLVGVSVWRADLLDHPQELHKLGSEQVQEFKEVFQLMDKDEDGILTFRELRVVMRALGQQPDGGVS